MPSYELKEMWCKLAGYDNKEIFFRLFNFLLELVNFVLPHEFAKRKTLLLFWVGGIFAWFGGGQHRFCCKTCEFDEHFKLGFEIMNNFEVNFNGNWDLFDFFENCFDAS